MVKGQADEQFLVRPRLIRRLSAALSTGTALVSGPYGAGKSTLVRSWARQYDAELVWFDGVRHLASTWDSLAAVLRRERAPVVAVLRGRAARDGEVLERLQRLQASHPALTIVLMRGLGMSISSGEPTLTSGAVITARELAFTPSEVTQLGEIFGATIDERTAHALVAHTGGYAMAVAAVAHAIRRTGQFTPRLLEETADLLMSAAAEDAGIGTISGDAWHRFLRTAIPDSLTFAQLGWIWATEEPERMVRVLEGSGLIQFAGDGREPRVVLVTALRAGLRRRLQVELTRGELERHVVEMAHWLDQHGDLERAVTLLEEYGLGSQLAAWATQRWQQLAQLPASTVLSLLRSVPAADQNDPRLLVAHARALVDVFHVGHEGTVRPQECRRASTMLDLAVSRDDTGDSVLEATALALRAVLSRIAGDHDRAVDLHRAAFDSATATASPALRSWLRAQSALTHMDLGDLAEAGDDLGRALDLLTDSGDGEGTRERIRALDRLVQGYRGALHPHDAGVRQGPRSSDALTAGIEALAETSRSIAQLDVARAWQQLERMPIATGAEDPALVLVLRAQAEAMAHLLAGTAVAGLGSLDVISALLHDRAVSPYASTVMRNTRAELLVAVGEPEAALQVLDAAGPPMRLASSLVRCVVLLALDRADEAADVVAPLLPSSSTWASSYPTWMLIVSALIFDDLGERDRADQLLGRGLAIASRSGAMLPFARQGPARLTQVIDRAQELRMDPASRTLLNQLVTAREHLRLSSVQARLSDRELIVLQRLRETGATRRLAALLHVSPNTVKSQLQSIYRKLGASTRVEALRAATLLGLLDDEVTT